jgi:3-dehydroquinate synthase
MVTRKFKFSTSSVNYFLDGTFSQLKKIAGKTRVILITDENVYQSHEGKFKNWDHIILKPGEEFKTQGTVDSLVETLIEMQADRNTMLVGVGGGVVTDITGYTASVYMRGIPFAFIPTTLLAMVDASIGGKNGIDVGVYKNMVGVIRQPQFILHDMSLLESLPLTEWENGFAEIIKHASIADRSQFALLEKNDISSYQGNRRLLTALVSRNALLKTRIVQRDEFEKNERRTLNFGHTLGHALENQYELSHGQAISIGMTYAAHFSEKLIGFKEAGRLVAVLANYGLPTYADFDTNKALEVMAMDKKREKKAINFILLQSIGKAIIEPVPIKQLAKLLVAAYH